MPKPSASSFRIANRGTLISLLPGAVCPRKLFTCRKVYSEFNWVWINNHCVKWYLGNYFVIEIEFFFHKNLRKFKITSALFLKCYFNKKKKNHWPNLINHRRIVLNSHNSSSETAIFTCSVHNRRSSVCPILCRTVIEASVGRDLRSLSDYFNNKCIGLVGQVLTCY